MYSEILVQEYEKLVDELNNVDEIVLFGNSIITPIINCVIGELKLSARTRIFDSGRYADGLGGDSNITRVIILCGMRKKTRNSMMNSINNLFPASRAICYDFFALYYLWVIEYIRRECDYEKLAETLLKARDEDVIVSLDSINTTYCSLNCMECSNGIQYRSNKKIVNKKKHELDIKIITNIRPILYCNLQGGEPLVDADFSSFIKSHAQNGHIGFITVATNATIVPSDEILKVMRGAGAMFRISDYGDLSTKKEMLIKKANDYAIPYTVYKYAKTWSSCGKIQKHNRSHEENRKIAKNCFFGTNCIMLYDSRLFCCCRTLLCDAKQIENDATNNNTVIVDENLTREKLDSIILGDNLYHMCDYCDFPMKEVEAAIQMS